MISERTEDLKFLPLREEHIPLIWQWLQEPHVAKYWQEPDCKDQVALRDKFLEKLPLRGVYPFILYVADSPAGYFQFYEAKRIGGGWWPQAKPGTFGIDQFIGDPGLVGRGIGARAIRRFVREVFSRTAALEVIADPDPLNERAVQTYRKCGFVSLGETTTPGGKAILMVARRRKSASEIQAILTDLDGVIRFFPNHRDSEIESRYGLAQNAISQIAFQPGLLEEVITGKIRDEAWREQILRKLQALYPELDAVSAMQDWSRSPGEVNLETLSLLRQLCPGPLVLLTNATSRLGADLKMLEIRSYFDLILNSSELGVAKPSREVFRLACERLALPADQILFIDDAEGNVAAANSAGFRAIHFTSHENLKRDLTSLLGEI